MFVHSYTLSVTLKMIFLILNVSRITRTTCSVIPVNINSTYSFSVIFHESPPLPFRKLGLSPSFYGKSLRCTYADKKVFFLICQKNDDLTQYIYALLLERPLQNRWHLQDRPLHKPHNQYIYQDQCNTYLFLP